VRTPAVQSAGDLFACIRRSLGHLMGRVSCRDRENVGCGLWGGDRSVGGAVSEAHKNLSEALTRGLFCGSRRRRVWTESPRTCWLPPPTRSKNYSRLHQECSHWKAIRCKNHLIL